MPKKSLIKILIIALALMLSLEALVSDTIISAAQKRNAKPPNPCAQTSDEEIVKAIKEKLAADPKIKDQMRHLNVSSKNRIVKLEGWLDDKQLISQAILAAQRTPCVKKVVSKLKNRGGGSCGPGQKPCGDICIDRDSACTILNEN